MDGKGKSKITVKDEQRLIFMMTFLKEKKRKISVLLGMLIVMLILAFVCAVPVSATSLPDDVQESTAITDNNTPFELEITSNAGSASLSSTLQILLLLTVISIAPSLLLMVTSFTRIIIVLHFVRAAMGTQTTPPNQVMVALALFLTFFIMAPTFTQVYNDAVVPLSEGKVTQEEAFKRGVAPIRTFMLKQTNRKDLSLFINIADIKTETLNNEDDIPLTVILPSFMISEMRKAFTIGFFIYLPFIVIDMVVASTLMSMGMMMLPPTTISMPFKILLFVLADGWNLIIGELVQTFNF